MPEPSLSEITNISADAERGTGTPAVVTDSSPIATSIQRLGQAKLENDWRKYTEFQSQLKDFYKNAQDIQSMEMAPQDREALQKQMGGIFKQIADDPHAFFGGPLKNKIEQQMAEISGHAAQSKQDLLYDKAHREFLTVNPGWATRDNMKKVDDYLDQPLGSRKPFLLQPTPVLDFDAMANSINGIIGKNVANTSFTGVDANGQPIPGNSYIMKTKGKAYPTDRYLQLAEASWDNAGQYGIKNRDAAEGLYKELSPEVQKAYGSAKDWYLTQLSARHKENDITDTQLVPNRFAEQSEKEKFAYGMEAYKQGNREHLARFKHNLSMAGAPANINFLVRQYASIAGNKTGEKRQVKVDGQWKTEDVLNVPPDVLKKFAGAGRTTIKKGKGGETETTSISNEPDIITRTDNGDLRTTYYQRYSEDDKKNHRIPKGKDVGDKVLTLNGTEIVQHQNVIPKREVMGLLGKDFVEKKLISSSIDAADQILNGQKDVSVFLDNVNEGKDSDEDDEENVPSGAPQSTPVKGAAKEKTYTFKGKLYTQTQIQKAAQQSGLSVDEYIKQAGLK